MKAKKKCASIKQAYKSAKLSAKLAKGKVTAATAALNKALKAVGASKDRNKRRALMRGAQGWKAMLLQRRARYKAEKKRACDVKKRVIANCAKAKEKKKGAKKQIKKAAAKKVGKKKRI